MKVRGRCQCGRIAYEAEIDPEKVILSNFPECQKVTGSAHRLSVPAPSTSFRLRSGKPAVYIKVAESGAIRLYSFCSDCGARVYSRAVHRAPAYWLEVERLGERPDLAPKKAIRCRSPDTWPNEPL